MNKWSKIGTVVMFLLLMQGLILGAAAWRPQVGLVYSSISQSESDLIYATARGAFKGAMAGMSAGAFAGLVAGAPGGPAVAGFTSAAGAMLGGLFGGNVGGTLGAL